MRGEWGCEGGADVLVRVWGCVEMESCRRALLDVGCFEVRLRFCETAGW
jgi:hypothetical protein